MKNMSDILIIYQSFHHQNTEKIVRALSTSFNIKALEVSKATQKDFDCNYLIFASGVYMTKPHRLFLEKIPETKSPKEILLITTSGIKNIPLFNPYRRHFRKFFESRGYLIRSWFETRGFDTYPVISKPFGGFSKGRPDSLDIERAITWLKKNL